MMREKVISILPHQSMAALQAREILNKRGLVYIFGQPRVGKSLTALETVRGLGRVLVVTKKGAIQDWKAYAEQYDYDVVNYEQIMKCSPDEYGVVVVDEAHNFNAFPRPSQRLTNIREFCKGKPVVFLSGTPFVESINGVYSQLSISSNSPFNMFKNGYGFFKEYGLPDITWIYGRQVESYKKGQTDRIMEKVEPLLVRMTYEDAGFVYQNEDDVHYIEANEVFQKIAHTVVNNHFITADGNCDLGQPLESIAAECQALHRLCGGLYGNIILPKLKLNWLAQYLKERVGQRIAIMCYFIEEQETLKELFGNVADVMSSTRYCEGIDLSDYDCYILYSFGYSGAKFIQLRDRIVNLNKDRKTKVVVPLIKGGVDECIYNVVSKKKTFNNHMISRLLR